MKMQSEDAVYKTRAMCSSVSEGTGGHNREEINVESSDICSCCAKCRQRCRIQIITFCCLCAAIITSCCVIMGYTNYTCTMTKETFNSRFLNLEQKLNRLQKKYLITKVSNLMTQRESSIQRQNLGEYENDDTSETFGSSMNTIESEEINIVKRSVNCENARTEKKRKKCQKRLKRKKKQTMTGKALVRLVNNTVHKTVKQAVAKAMEKGKGMSFMHFMADDNEEPPNEDFAGRFHKWQYSDWAHARTDLKEKFRLHPNSGTVVLSEGGIYMLYAQVTLIGRPDQGFKVVVQHENDSEEILTKCMMDYVSEKDDRQGVSPWLEDGNITCSSIGVFKLEKGDRVFLTHSRGTNVKADFRGNASFFGFVKLG